jgi:hypothetical protein
MSVVNCKVKYIRPKYKNLEEWMKNDNNVYIGRAGVVFVNNVRCPKKASEFANPYRIGKDGTRDEVLEKYRIYIENRLKTDENLLNELKKLEGKNLGCWCSPDKCHGDILLEILTKINK